MITEDRIEELREMWEDERDDDWRDDLTQEEYDLLDKWDTQYERKIARIAQDILDRKK